MIRKSNLRQTWRAAATLAALSLPAALAAAPATPNATLAKSDFSLTQTMTAPQTSGWSSVILKTQGALTQVQTAQLSSLGVDITRRLPIIQSVSVRVPSHNLVKLAALPFVTHLSLNGMVKKSDEFTVNCSGANQAAVTDNWGNATRLTGQGVTVAVIDSGIAPVQDLTQTSHFLLLSSTSSRVVASVNFSSATSNGGGDVSASDSSGLKLGFGILGLNLGSGGASTNNNGNSYDPCGHGTHVAGIIAGNGTKSSGRNCFRTFYGIAPQANLVSVRVLDQVGRTDVATVITGIQWVVSNAQQYNIRVINLSLGHPVGDSYVNDPLCQAVEAAYQAGIVVVCAAGNEGRASDSYTSGVDNEGWGTSYGSIQSPGNDPYIITVGATKNMDGNRNNDRVATYSSRGPSRVDLILKPDIIAPGNKIISLDADGSVLDTYAGGTNNIPQSAYMSRGSKSTVSTDYFQLSGTSMASPVVAGAAALLLQADPSLTPDTIKARLMLSADKWADPMGNADALTYGAGYLNIPATLQNTTTAQGPAVSPALTIDPSTGNVSICMDRAVWGRSLWGTGITDLRAVWGSLAVTSTDTLSASRAVWGKNSVSASRAVWGKNSISGSSVWADRAVWGKNTTTVDLTSTAIQGE